MADRESKTTGIKVAAARLSIVSNITLTALKLAVGIVSGSVSVLSEAVHSASDLFASIIAYFSVQVAAQPADEKHPYGHGKAESLSGLAEAVIIVLAAGYIIYEAVERLVTPHRPPRIEAAMAVMVVSAIVNTLVSQHLFKVAKETDSQALEADGAHLRTDVWTSIGVLAGLALVRLTGFNHMDSIAAIVVALLILHAAWRLTNAAVAPLMDTQLPEEEIELVKIILESDPEVLSYHKLRTRKSGAWRHVDAHVLLDDNLSLLEAHTLTERLEDRIRASLPNIEITLHTEPYEAEQQHQHEQHGGPPPSSAL